MSKNKKLQITVGIAAYNEEKNIALILDSILKQKLKSASISEILIISSGSTDNTNNIVKRYAKRFKKINLYKQSKRLGKASAVNTLLNKAKKEIIVLVSADILLKDNTFEKLLTPLRKSDIGITGAHPIPLNNKNNFFGFAAHLQWRLHHLISLKSPKMGECIAFKKVFKRIHVLTAVDEVNIESLIKGQGYKAVYVPNALVFNKGPENLSEFINARRRIYVGHLATKNEYSYTVSTLKGTKILLLLFKNFKLNLKYIFWTPFVILLEIYSRILGFIDYKITKKNHTIWTITKSTKQLPVSKTAARTNIL